MLRWTLPSKPVSHGATARASCTASPLFCSRSVSASGPCRDPQGVSYAAQCAAAAAYGQAARSLSLAARFGNAADRERERSRPLLGLGLTLPALIWSGALGFWGLSGFVSPMLALATGSPFIDVSQLAKQYVAAPTHPAMPDAGLGGHSGSADVALLPGSADPPLNSASLDERPAAGAGAGADATVDGPAPPGDTPAAPESASAPAGLLPGAGAAAFLVVFPCSMAGVTLTLSHNSIVAVVPAALVGAAAAASGAVVAASGIDAVDAVAHSRWLYYRLLAGQQPPAHTLAGRAEEGAPATASGSADALAGDAVAASRDAAQRIAMGHLAVSRQSAQASSVPTSALALWLAPALLVAVAAALVAVAVVRKHGRLSMHRQADRPHLAARAEEEDEAAALQASAAGGAAAIPAGPAAGRAGGSAAMNGMQARPGSDPRVTVSLGMCGRALRVAWTFISAACVICCRCDRAGRGRAATCARRPCSLAAGPGWDAEGRHWAAAEAEPPSAPPPPDPAAVQARFRRRRRRRGAADEESRRLLQDRPGDGSAGGSAHGSAGAGATAPRAARGGPGARAGAVSRRAAVDGGSDSGPGGDFLSDDESTGGSSDGGGGFAGSAVGRGSSTVTAVEVTSGTAEPPSILWWRAVEPLATQHDSGPLAEGVAHAAARGARAE